MAETYKVKCKKQNPFSYNHNFVPQGYLPLSLGYRNV